VPRDLERAGVQVFVAADDFCDLEQDVFAVLLQIDAPGIEKDVARQLDRHSVFAHGHVQTELGERIELLLERFETLADLLELLFVLAQLVERLFLLGEIGVQVRKIDAGLLQLTFQLVDLSRGSRKVRLGLLMGSLFGVQLVL
jgi:hypothetical protein